MQRRRDRCREGRPSLTFLVGTRPEAIKLAPVILGARDRGLGVEVVSSGQHGEILASALAFFGISPDRDLGVFSRGQSLSEMSAKVTRATGDLLGRGGTDALVVQGDTTSASAAALAATYAAVPVVHVEAGLRTGIRNNPFPEEINRRLISVCADLHLAPTALAATNLRREGVPSGTIRTTGNTVVDALQMAQESMDERRVRPDVRRLYGSGRRTILVTTHRRESWGSSMQAVVRAIRDSLSTHPDAQVLLPVHPNPVVRETISAEVARCDRFVLSEPLGYRDFVYALSRSYLVATDSGGVQEEAPTFGVPVLVLRESTERPEGVAAGVAVLAGTSYPEVRARIDHLLDSADAHGAMSRAVSPYGDGRAAERCLSAIEELLGTGSTYSGDFAPDAPRSATAPAIAG